MHDVPHCEFRLATVGMVDALLHTTIAPRFSHHADVFGASRSPATRTTVAIAGEAWYARLGALHAEQLLTDEELWTLEDMRDDYLELRALVAGVVSHRVDMHGARREICCHR